MANQSLNTRRKFLRWSGRVGLTTVGALAGLTATQETAQAVPCIPTVCCCLIRPSGGCPGSGPSHTCPPGYAKRFWQCCSGPRLWSCSECTTVTNCFNANTSNTACSEHWSSGLAC